MQVICKGLRPDREWMSVSQSGNEAMTKAMNKDLDGGREEKGIFLDFDCGGDEKSLDKCPLKAPTSDGRKCDRTNFISVNCIYQYQAKNDN